MQYHQPALLAAVAYLQAVSVCTSPKTYRHLSVGNGGGQRWWVTFIRGCAISFFAYNKRQQQQLLRMHALHVPTAQALHIAGSILPDFRPVAGSSVDDTSVLDAVMVDTFSSGADTRARKLEAEAASVFKAMPGERSMLFLLLILVLLLLLLLVLLLLLLLGSAAVAVAIAIAVSGAESGVLGARARALFLNLYTKQHAPPSSSLQAAVPRVGRRAVASGWRGTSPRAPLHQGRPWASCCFAARWRCCSRR